MNLGYRIAHEEDYCERCRQEPCECCGECGATPEQACEPWCGLQTDTAEEVEGGTR